MSKCSKRRRRPIEGSLNAKDDSSRSCTPQPKLTQQWSKEEDDVVMKFVGYYGPMRWSLMASNLPGRAKSGKQCRERWYNQLDPNIRKEGWTDEEDLVIIKAHSEVSLCYFSFAICVFSTPLFRFLMKMSLSWGAAGWRSRVYFPAVPTIASRTGGTPACTRAPFRHLGKGLQSRNGVGAGDSPCYPQNTRQR